MLNMPVGPIVPTEIQNLRNQRLGRSEEQVKEAQVEQDYIVEARSIDNDSTIQTLANEKQCSGPKKKSLMELHNEKSGNTSNGRSNTMEKNPLEEFRHDAALNLEVKNEFFRKFKDNNLSDRFHKPR